MQDVPSWIYIHIRCKIGAAAVRSSVVDEIVGRGVRADSDFDYPWDPR